VTFPLFLQHLANAISLGSLYALIAIGYTMVYGILRLINFAHGDIFMMGAYVAFYGILLISLPWWLAFAVAVLLTSFIGILIDRGAYRPLRSAPRISALISAIGVSFFLQNFAIVVFSGRPKAFFRPPLFTRVFVIKGVNILSVTFFIPVIAFISLAALSYIIYRTKPGLAMRAVSHDMETARIMGVDVDRTIALTFALGSGLAAIGGIMWGLRYPQIQPLMGVIPGLKAFVAAILGGIGSVPGAMIGGFVLGLAEIMLVAFAPALAGYRDAFAFLILIVVLLLRPTGILGRRLEEKV